MNAVQLKQGIDPMFKYPEPYTGMPKTKDAPFNYSDRDGPCDPIDEKTFKFTNAELAKFNLKSNQYGNQSRTENIASTAQELSGPYVSTVNYGKRPMKTVKFTEEAVNESSNTFKYGEHYKGAKTQTSDLDLILRGVMDAVPVKNRMGPRRNAAGAWSGAVGEKMAL